MLGGSYFLIFVVCVSLFFGINSAFAQSSIVVTTDKASYTEGETILITGEVSQLLGGYALHLTVIHPDGSLVSIDQLTVGADKKFSTTLAAGGTLMDIAGTYTVTVQYRDNQNNVGETTFEFTTPQTEPEITLLEITIEEGIEIPGVGKSITINMIGAVQTVEIKITAEDGEIIDDTLTCMATSVGSCQVLG